MRQIARIEHPTAFKEAGKCSGWTYRLDWMQAQNATVTTIVPADPTRFGGAAAMCWHSPHATSGLERPRVLEGEVDLPYLFLDKPIVTVELNNAYLESSGMLPYTYCEVYAPLGINTNVGEAGHRCLYLPAQLPHFFRAPPTNPTFISGVTISFLPHQLMDSYAHFIEEGLSRLPRSHMAAVASHAAQHGLGIQVFYSRRARAQERQVSCRRSGCSIAMIALAH